MAKKNSKKEEPKLLTDEQEKELQDMVNGMLDIAANVVEEYKEYDDLDLGDLYSLSGSITQINQNSPFLDEIFKGDQWKRVIKNLDEITTENKKNDSE
jgi:hypothetical protein